MAYAAFQEKVPHIGSIKHSDLPGRPTGRYVRFQVAATTGESISKDFDPFIPPSTLPSISATSQLIENFTGFAIGYVTPRNGSVLDKYIFLVTLRF